MAKKKMSMVGVVVVGMVMAAAMLEGTYAVTYTVGDTTGWQVPTSQDFYDNWASRQRFVVGDVLVFNFVGDHVAAQVTEAAYDNCNTANPISVQTASPARFTLNSTGDHFFICTVGAHCSNGQRLDVEVNPAPVSPPGATPTTPSSPPTTTPNSPPSTGTPPGTVTPTPPNSAPPKAVAAFSLLLISVAAAFMS